MGSERFVTWRCRAQAADSRVYAVGKRYRAASSAVADSDRAIRRTSAAVSARANMHAGAAHHGNQDTVGLIDV